MRYQRAGSVSRVMYHVTASSSVLNTPLWKYGPVSAILRKVGTLNAPHTLVRLENSVRSGPHSPRSK